MKQITFCLIKNKSKMELIKYLILQILSKPVKMYIQV